jgi:hypothetical protein
MKENDIKGCSFMRGKKVWKNTVRCDDWSDATINLHITKSDRRKIRGFAGRVSYINPNRIGMDFDNFDGESHAFIPNLNLADVIQLVNRLGLLSSGPIRKALKSKKLPHKFGVELDSRRKIDFDIGKCPTSGEEEIRIYYMDPLRKISRFEIGRINANCLYELI